MVVTPNVDHVVRVNKDVDFKSIYSTAEVSVNDSRVLKLLTSFFLGEDLGVVIPGSDLTKAILEKKSGSNVSITVVGCSRKTINIVKEKYSLTNVSHYNPPMGFIADEKEVKLCVDFVKSHPSDFVFLSVGSPRQEILADNLRNAGASGVVLCVGASLLFLSGEEKRAPKFFQRFSLEWLFRLIQSPRRLAKRYLVDGLSIFPILIKERLKK
jgi:exopolysaccharide biosynthesis WecB/TagA/CpsF family protein